METLLIFVAIFAIDAVIKAISKRKLRQQQPPPSRVPQEQIDDEESVDSDTDDWNEGNEKPRSLEDLIRQFEEAQRQATQGNIEPATPPTPKPQPRKGPLTLRDVAEVVVDFDCINEDFLMETFEVDRKLASQILADLQTHRIVGRDMGEGYCDVLVHDIEELENLFIREEREAENQRIAEERQRRERDETQRRALERQRELNSLEKRAQAARESAASIAEFSAKSEEPVRKHPLSKDINDIRKGFVWAKILDEPRFKKHWSREFR